MHIILNLISMQHKPHELFFNCNGSKMLLDFKLGNIPEGCQRVQTSLMLWRDKHLTHFIVYLASCSSVSDRVNACDVCFNCCELASGWGTHVRGTFEEMPSTLAHEVWWAAFFWQRTETLWNANVGKRKMMAIRHGCTFWHLNGRRCDRGHWLADSDITWPLITPLYPIFRSSPAC